jgi:hypothetical protein
MLNATRIPHKMMDEETIDALAISLISNQIILLRSFSPKSPVPSHAPLLPSYPIPDLSAVVVIRTPDPECLASSSAALTMTTIYASSIYHRFLSSFFYV